TGLLNSLEVLRPAAELADSIDGSSVNIMIPLIDYGFSGSFDNAWLRVSRRGGGQYFAIGPQDIMAGPGVACPIAGRVTIEEHTPTLVRGTCAGDLVDMDRVERVGDNPTLPVHETIAGTFQIVAPWRGDERVTVVQPGDPFDNVVQDLR